jgi:hypothetical protein
MMKLKVFSIKTSILTIMDFDRPKQFVAIPL